MVFVGFYIILCLCLPSVLGYMQVRVNKMLLMGLSTGPAWPSKDIEVEYYYVEGEEVDLWCLKANTDCKLELEYDFKLSNLGGKGNMDFKAKDQNGYIGLRTTLKPEHHDKIIKCVLKCPSFHYAINTRLLETEPSDGALDIKINNMISSYKHPIRLAEDGTLYTVEYAFKERERVVVEGMSRIPGAVIRTYHNNKEVKSSTVVDTAAVDSVVRYEAVKGTEYLRKVIVRILRKFSHIIEDDRQLSVNISGSSIGFELYEHKRTQQVVHSFYDGDVLIVECKTLHGLIASHNYRLKFGDVVETRNDSVINRLELNHTWIERTLNCTLMDEFDTVLRKVFIRFRLKTKSFNWMIAAVGILLAIILLSICLALCFILRRSCMGSDDDGDDDRAGGGAGGQHASPWAMAGMQGGEAGKGGGGSPSPDSGGVDI